MDEVKKGWDASVAAREMGVVPMEEANREGSPFFTFTKCFMNVYQMGLEDGGRLAIEMYSEEIRRRASMSQGTEANGDAG